jgi:hypothetical protein
VFETDDTTLEEPVITIATTRPQPPIVEPINKVEEQTSGHNLVEKEKELLLQEMKVEGYEKNYPEVHQESCFILCQ